MLKAQAHAITVFLAAVFSIICVSLLLNHTVPESILFWQMGLLYFLVFSFVCAVAFLTGYYLRILLWRSGNRLEFYRSARRQAVSFSFLTVILLALSAGRILNLWIAALLVAVFLMLELYLN